MKFIKIINLKKINKKEKTMIINDNILISLKFIKTNHLSCVNYNY